ncbi:hypothetical protein PsorP6_010551 [Peronosclerospora sorghi]|uniref:Uncharacterized protein n=1 Tax=Peronosclerospora sorghi TaxID=230839 RepID=A0ACC0VWN9_9STRA|nr:hypothetical protein PsorP6_010551 [Peronosclerospora sorghi]
MQRYENYTANRFNAFTTRAFATPGTFLYTGVATTDRFDVYQDFIRHFACIIWMEMDVDTSFSLAQFSENDVKNAGFAASAELQLPNDSGYRVVCIAILGTRERSFAGGQSVML